MQTFTIGGALDLVVLAPHVLGFRPEESVVLISLGAEDGIHARLDLPVTPEDQAEAIDLLTRVAEERGVTVAAVLVFTEDAGAARCFASRLARALQRRDIVVLEQLLVDAERFRRLDDPADSGTPYDLSTHPLTLRRVLEGIPLHASREELADSLRPGPHDDLDEVERSSTKAFVRLYEIASEREEDQVRRYLRRQARWVARRVRRWEDERERLSAADAGRLIALMGVPSVRDVAWADLDRGRAAVCLGLWRDVLRRAPEHMVPGVAALTAFAAWLAGNGALAWCALERCVEVTGGAVLDDVLVDLVSRLLTDAVPPDIWAPIPVEELPVLRART